MWLHGPVANATIGTEFQNDRDLPVGGSLFFCAVRKLFKRSCRPSLGCGNDDIRGMMRDLSCVEFARDGIRNDAGSSGLVGCMGSRLAL